MSSSSSSSSSSTSPPTIIQDPPPAQHNPTEKRVNPSPSVLQHLKDLTSFLADGVKQLRPARRSASHQDLLKSAFNQADGLEDMKRLEARQHDAWQQQRGLAAPTLDGDSVSGISSYRCDLCSNHIPRSEIRIRCLECHDFDLCQRCYRENLVSHVQFRHAALLRRDEILDLDEPQRFAPSSPASSTSESLALLKPLWRSTDEIQRRPADASLADASLDAASLDDASVDEDSPQDFHRLAGRYRLCVPEPAYGITHCASKTTLASVLESVFKYYAERPCLGARKRIPTAAGGRRVLDGRYSWLTFNQVYCQARRVVAGLRHLLSQSPHIAPTVVGDKPRHFCGIFSPYGNVETWITDIALTGLGGFVTSPILVTSPDEDVVWILQKATISVAFVVESELRRFLALARGSVPLVVALPDYDAGPLPLPAPAEHPSVRVVAYAELLRLGQLHPAAFEDAVGPADLITLIWTSGSTGRPKACSVISASWGMDFRRGMVVSEISFCYSFSDRRNCWLGFTAGGRIGIASHDLGQILDDLAVLRPTLMCTTPRIFALVHSEYLERLAQAPEREAQLLAEYGQIFGDRLASIVVGGAHTPPALLEWLRRCFAGARVEESFGTTEAGGVARNGALICDWRLEDWECYRGTDLPFPRGELSVKTNRSVTMRYFGEEALNDEAFTPEGFYRTGDIVELYRIGYVRIIDRRKNFFKLQQGEFVVPQQIEGVLSQSLFIDQVCVVGSLSESCLVAIVFPRLRFALQSLAAKRPAPADPEWLQRMESHIQQAPGELPEGWADDEGLRHTLLMDILQVCTTSQLKPFEVPRAVILAAHKFSPENHLLTESLKPRRFSIEQLYQQQIQDAYAQLRAATTGGPSSSSSAVPGCSEAPVSSVFAKLVDLLARNLELPPGVLLPETELSTLGLNSIATVKILRGIQAQFGLELSLKTLHQCGSLDRLTQFISSVQEGEMPKPVTVPFSWLDEANRHIAELSPCTSPEATTTTSDDNDAVRSDVFLTGATGYLGAFLLREILAMESPSLVYCLVRAQPGASSQDRLQEHLADLQITISAADFARRIRLVEGRLEAPRFGLSADLYATLSRDVALIIHSAAHVNSVLPYDSLRAANVDGVKEILRLAGSSERRKFLAHISTMSVLVNSVVGRHEDSSLEDHATSLDFTGGYNQSKWVGEMLVQHAIRELGYRGCIFRPGMISASTSGPANINDFDTRLLTGLVKMGTAPFPSRSRLDQCPVDFVARSIVTISSKNAVIESPASEHPWVFHFGNPNGSIGLDQMVEWLIEMGYRLRKLAYSEWVSELFGLPESNPLYPMIEGYFVGRLSFPFRLPLTEAQMKNTLALVGPPPPITFAGFQEQIQWLVNQHVILSPRALLRNSMSASMGSATRAIDHDNVLDNLI